MVRRVEINAAVSFWGYADEWPDAETTASLQRAREVLAVGWRKLALEKAREWLRLQLSEADTDRVRELSSKANAGTLPADEDRELEQYLNVGRTLECLKAKARLPLRDAA
jgi:hypothetical protein